MPCFAPVTAWRVEGQRKLTFREAALRKDPRHGDGLRGAEKLQLRCGRCLDCKARVAHTWATRMVHEAQTGEGCSYFLTLTYDDAHLPARGELAYRDFQLFMKRLRKEHGAGVKFVMCGEYGARNGRPHYHACMFHLPELDLAAERAPNGEAVSSCRTVADLWGAGFVQVDEFTEGRALYLAKYLLKEGERPEQLDPVTGELYRKRAPFRRMSLRPGIGAGWFSRFGASDYAAEGCVVLGTAAPGEALKARKVGGNRFYDGRLERADPVQFALVKGKRRAKAVKLSPDELDRREAFAKAMADRAQRPL